MWSSAGKELTSWFSVCVVLLYAGLVVCLLWTFEPPHDKTNKMTVHPAKTQSIPSAQSDQSLRCPHEESFGP